MDQNIKNIQEALFLCGAYPGTVDGIMGPNTKKAVRAFQEKEGLDADGIPGANTKKALVARLGEVMSRATALMGELSV